MKEFRRDVQSALLRWSTSPSRRPLVLRGARQVGKTHVLRMLGQGHYRSCAYVNLFDVSAKSALSGAGSAQILLDSVEAYTGVRVREDETLLIIDEIQEIPALLTMLKSFKEQLPRIHIAAAGSYLGLAQHEGTSFPVGAVETMVMRPMSFLEFLDATGDDVLARHIEDLDFGFLEGFADRLDRRVRQYCYVGGMPAAVDAFLNDGYQAARDIQTGLLSDYDMDFSKHPQAGGDVERVRLAFASIPTHLARENHKFVFGHIAKGARSVQYESAIQKIVDSGLATRVFKVTKPALPLRAYQDLSAFKLYMHDVGLLAAAMAVEPADLILADTALTEFRGALTEQYVCQQLVSEGVDPSYWATDNSSGGVDFIFRHGGAVIPLEVKAGVERQAKSLRWLCGKFGLRGYRTSLRGYREQDWMTNVPLWAVGAFFRSRPQDGRELSGDDLAPLGQAGGRVDESESEVKST
ncbi:ATP-binding protein [Bifidobacterium eulemuris]|uniref:ATP-binding protein n=1 Tax=Bifidobacterium eulemuris TaxID=1765219 RepID=A0A7L9STP8_9BIFI|nr:ATP-binding protein [Bifidobacterium eulemuris]